MTDQHSRRNTVSGLPPRRLEHARVLDEADIPLVKGMLLRGDPQSDIAAWFGTNGGRISEINTRQKHADVAAAAPELLPPPGPYLAARSAHKAKQTLEAMQVLLDAVLAQIKAWETQR